MEKGRTQSWHFWSNFDPSFPPGDDQNQKKKKKKIKKKKKQSCGKTSVIKLSKYFKMNSLSHLPFPGNI